MSIPTHTARNGKQTFAKQGFTTPWREYKEDGQRYRIRATLRFDDQCKNGHEDFSIVGETQRAGDGMWEEDSGGCIHNEIAEHFPEYAHLIKWHLCGVEGPMHYLANVIHFAGDRDYNGLRKGEKKPLLTGGKPGAFSWYMAVVDHDGNEIQKHGRLPDFVSGAEPPGKGNLLKVEWRMHTIKGEGKERELDSARRIAVWPEATDEELCAEPLILRLALTARLPALIAAFKINMLALGFGWPESASHEVADL